MNKPLFHRSLFLLAGFLLSCLITAPVFAQERSVVRVHADSSSGYGVAWGGPQKTPDRIVTALHVVSGKKTIMVDWEGKASRATIEKIYKPADLALLKLQTPLNIPQLELYIGDAPLATSIEFWQKEKGKTLITSKITQLEKNTVLGKLNPRIDPAGFAKALCLDGSQNYPAMSTPIIKFSNPNIKKAHSGAPLTYSKKLVGLIDGGEKLVNGTESVWAIPASEFNNLLAKGTPAPASMQSCTSGGKGSMYMYSGLSSDNPLLSPEQRARAQEMEQESLTVFDAEGNALASLSIEYRMTCEEVFETLFEEEMQYIDDLLDGETEYEASQQIDFEQLLSQLIDIYYDANTGATIAIPANSELSKIQEGPHTLIEASSPYEGITLSIYSFHGENIAECQEAMTWFKDYMDMGDRPELDEGDEDVEDYLDDEYNPYYSEIIEASSNADGLESEIFMSMTIDNTNLLCVAVQITDWSQLDEDAEERLFFYLMETCVILTDFPFY